MLLFVRVYVRVCFCICDVQRVVTSSCGSVKKKPSCFRLVRRRQRTVTITNYELNERGCFIDVDIEPPSVGRAAAAVAAAVLVCHVTSRD